MTKKDKEEFRLLFNQGFEELVLPEIEVLRGQIKETATKKELEALKEEVKSGFERVERRVDAMAIKQGDQDKRLQKLEVGRITA